MRTPGTCGTCTKPLLDIDAGGDRCNNCWEVERRLSDYLRAGQVALDFVQLALDERAQGIRLVQAVRHTEARDEAEHAAALWLRLVAVWEASKEDSLDDEIGELMAEWHAGAGDRGEIVKAASLWERLVTIWESDDGTSTKAHDPEILERIAMLVNEWQGFADEKPEAT